MRVRKPVNFSYLIIGNVKRTCTLISLLKKPKEASAYTKLNGATIIPPP